VLGHLYKMACRLADICRVASWQHHYRVHNKMADWLANEAMNGRRSVMVHLTADNQEHKLNRGL
jgi:hypothetical protein